VRPDVPIAGKPGVVARTIYRSPIGPLLGSLFVVALLCVCSVGFTVVSVWLLLQPDFALVALVVALAGGLMAALAAYCARDLRGKWGLRVAFDDAAVILDLPRGRSLLHDPPTQQSRISFTDIAAIETRLEAYTSAGRLAMLQRPYVLRRTNGDMIFLFEDSAVGTRFESRTFARVADEIAARAGAKVRDLGMNEGGGGVLGVWGTEAADWAAPALSAARQAQLWRTVSFTGTLPMALIMLAYAFKHLFGG
jgi:hypothetical protein